MIEGLVYAVITRWQTKAEGERRLTGSVLPSTVAGGVKS